VHSPRRDSDPEPERSDLDLIASALGPTAPRPARTVHQQAADTAEVEAYFGYQRHARTTFENLRRENTSWTLRRQADDQRACATTLNEQAERARQRGFTLRKEHLKASARHAARLFEDFESQADRVAAGDLVPAVVEVAGADWARINNDVGNLVTGGVDTDDSSRLTDADHPPPVNRSRRYDVPGGLRRPLGVHQRELELAMPRDGDGRVQRRPDPREGKWFDLANDGGPEADPTRGINCVDGVLSLFDTYVHGRPRVSAPRTFDSYAWGDPQRPLGPENGGIDRIQHVTQGHFAALTPPNPANPKRAVDDAMHHLMAHVGSLEHGAFAFIVTQSEGGDAHAWAAVNHHGTILFLDPQTRQVSEDFPLYRHTGTPSLSNVVAVSALVTDPDGNYASPPRHEATRPGAPPDPTGSPVSDETPAQAHERMALAALSINERELLIQNDLDCRSVAADAHADVQGAAEAVRAEDDAERPEVFGTENRVKTPGSIARAYLEEQETKQIELPEFLSTMKDRVRFSMQLPERDYAAAVKQALEGLERRGYQVKDMLSFWGHGGRHNGLNVTLADPSGILIEVQFPTELSRKIGESTHDKYEIIRQSGLPFEERVEAFLSILKVNKLEGIDDRVPDGLDRLGAMVRTRDTTFDRFVERHSGLWRDYLQTLGTQGRTFDDVMSEHGLTADDVFSRRRGGRKS
jgi:hypothetical protein